MAPTFELTEVSGGVWAAIAPGFAGPAVSNAAIIDLGDKTVVFDTFMTGLAAEELAAEAKRLTGREVSVVVNSHWHSDHVRGNRVFAGRPIVGTRRMLELILEDMPKTGNEMLEAAEGIRALAEQRAAAAETDEERSAAAGTFALADAVTADGKAFNFALPDYLIEDSLVVEGERSVHILGYGPGHTESDLFAYLPEDKILAAGDLVWNGIHPKTDDSFPSEWAHVLTQIAALGVSRVIPGHGDVALGGQVVTMADYMTDVAAVFESVRTGAIAIEEAAPPRDWDGVARFRAGLERLKERFG